MEPTPAAVPDLDLQLAPASLAWVLEQLDREGVVPVLEQPSPDGWTSQRTTGAALQQIVARAADAWIVQRPRCVGLVTRVLLCDGDGAPFASLAAARGPSQPEPTAWRVVLLVALLDGRDRQPQAQAAK
ncbi:MAG: hypothetical protein R3F59_16615 [Myxococcota bacterium]